MPTKKVAKKTKPGIPRAELARKAERILDVLSEIYPDARCALDYRTPEQLLVATILSAQCTDVMVNKVTAVLFAKYPDAPALAKAKLADVEAIIRPTGFFHSKAKNIIACAKALVKDHGGKAPQTMEELVVLPGVGRKTANVVLGNAFGVPGIAVDTHVKRIVALLGLTREEDPEKIEALLMEILPKERWTMASHWLIHHGRKICLARSPRCGECPVRQRCDYGIKSLI